MKHVDVKPDTSVCDLNVKKIYLDCLCKNELQKTSSWMFRIEKLIKKKGYQMYVLWKRYDYS